MFAFPLIIVSHLLSASDSGPSPFPLIEISEIAPTIQIDARYAGPFNFVGTRIDGYEGANCWLSRSAARALAKVQKRLEPMGLGLKVYDCYRPQRAVNHFVRWAKDLSDKRMKGVFYPFENKHTLFARGYIASKSGHSRGSTVDLTLVPLPSDIPSVSMSATNLSCLEPKGQRAADNSLDMGTGYDCFDTRSHTKDARISSQARANRLLLRTVMKAEGFKNYSKEWWHYTLRDEPYPKTYFDEPVR